MNPDLEGLVRLQRAETELRRVEGELAEVPKEKEALEAALASERARLDAAREALAASQKSRRQHETDLQDLETKRSRYKGQLMEVKTNKEYTAMLHEIEAVEREIRGREDQILGEMERAETLTAEVKSEEAEFKRVEARHRDDARTLDQRGETLKAETARLGAERDAIAATLSPSARALFERVARLRGVAVAEARDGMCLLCHVKVRPQMFLDLKHNDQVVQCPSCSRILYYEPPVPVVEAPQP
jgi:predicted  nucleic acid-binding Zn-ribbon protein